MRLKNYLKMDIINNGTSDNIVMDNTNFGLEF